MNINYFFACNEQMAKALPQEEQVDVHAHIFLSTEISKSVCFSSLRKKKKPLIVICLARGFLKIQSQIECIPQKKSILNSNI